VENNMSLMKEIAQEAGVRAKTNLALQVDEWVKHHANSFEKVAEAGIEEAEALITRNKEKKWLAKTTSPSKLATWSGASGNMLFGKGVTKKELEIAAAEYKLHYATFCEKNREHLNEMWRDWGLVPNGFEPLSTAASMLTRTTTLKRTLKALAATAVSDGHVLPGFTCTNFHAAKLFRFLAYRDRKNLLIGDGRINEIRGCTLPTDNRVLASMLIHFALDSGKYTAALQALATKSKRNILFYGPEATTPAIFKPSELTAQTSPVAAIYRGSTDRQYYKIVICKADGKSYLPLKLAGFQ